MADREGIVYIRTLRPNTPVIYDPDDEFEIGGSRTLRAGEDVALVAAGVTPAISTITPILPPKWMYCPT